MNTSLVLTGGRGRGRRPIRLGVALVLSIGGGLIPATLASANNDPHRVFAAASPFDLPASYCGFPVHLAFPVDNEYSTVSAGPDGSTVITTTGSLVVSVTNEVSAKTISVNASGPGTIIVSADGTTATINVTGIGLLYAANGTQFGLPSDLVVTAGPVKIGADLASDTITSMVTQPRVLLDVCAALG